MLELNRIHEGDCLQVMREIPDESVHMIVADMPYGVSFKSNMGEAGFQKEAIENDGFEEWLKVMPKWIHSMKRVLVPGGTLALFSGICSGTTGKRVAPLHHAMREVEGHCGELADVIVWDRCDMGMGWAYRPVWEAIIMAHKNCKARVDNTKPTQTNILRHPRIIPKAGEHPTPKPIPLIGDLIRNSTNEGDLILDPF